MLVVGLTGGIATGKSSVSTILKSRYDVPVIDADLLARKVVEPGTPCYFQIVAAFGNEILAEDGHINRPQLGQIIFNDEAKRRQLNNIVHPAVRRAMFWSVIKCWLTGKPLCVLDIPLLFETGLHKWMGWTVVIYCPLEIQLQRLMSRDQSTEEEALARLESQIPIDEKARQADYILDNTGPYNDLENRVRILHERLQQYTGKMVLFSWLCPPLGILLAVRRLLIRHFGSS